MLVCSSTLGRPLLSWGLAYRLLTAVDQGDIQFLHHKVVCLIVQQVAQTSLGFSRLLGMILNSWSSCLYFSSAWIAGIHYPASRSEVFILKLYLLLLYTCIHIFWKYRVFLLSAHRGQNQVQGPLEPELQIVVSHHVGAGHWIPALCKSKTYLEPPSHFFSPDCNVLRHLTNGPVWLLKVVFFLILNFDNAHRCLCQMLHVNRSNEKWKDTSLS